MRHSPAAAAGLLLAVVGAAAADPPCEPGYRWADQVVYKDVERLVCKVVPDVKKVKKVVYTQKDDPFCRPAHKPGCADPRCGGCCPDCKGPYTRKILVKTEVTCEEPTTKCVVARVVERVPCTVRVKVPCDPGPPDRP
jgi:hypothetical protein